MALSLEFCVHLSFFLQNLVTMVVHAPELFPKVRLQIAGEYGIPDDPESPGPFSYYSYIEFMMGKDTWADAVQAYVVAYQWNLRVTIYNIPSMSEIRLRHHKEMINADLILLYDGSRHYSAVCKYIVSDRVVRSFSRLVEECRP